MEENFEKSLKLVECLNADTSETPVSLNFYWYNLTPEDLQEILDALTNRSLHAFNNEWNSFDSIDAIKSLNRVLTYNNIQHLNLGANQLTDKSVEVLSKGIQNNLRLITLELYANKITSKGMVPLCSALSGNNCLQSLSLRANSLGRRGCRVLSSLLREKSLNLTHLDLGSNDIGDEGVEYLCDAIIENCAIKTLLLWWNSITSRGIKAICRVLQNRSIGIETINLMDNFIDVEGARELSKSLIHNSSLTKLILFGTKIENEGIVALSVAMKQNRFLRHLDLRYNNIKDGASSIAEFISVNTSLTKLSLQWNAIGNEGVRIISNSLRRNFTLTNLDLANNCINDGVIETLINCISNTSISYVDLRNNALTNQSLVHIPLLLFDDSWKQLSHFLLDNNNITPLGIFRAIMAIRVKFCELLKIGNLKLDVHIRYVNFGVMRVQNNIIFSSLIKGAPCYLSGGNPPPDFLTRNDNSSSSSSSSSIIDDNKINFSNNSDISIKRNNIVQRENTNTNNNNNNIKSRNDNRFKNKNHSRSDENSDDNNIKEKITIQSQTTTTTTPPSPHSKQNQKQNRNQNESSDTFNLKNNNENIQNHVNNNINNSSNNSKVGSVVDPIVVDREEGTIKSATSITHYNVAYEEDEDDDEDCETASDTYLSAEEESSSPSSSTPSSLLPIDNSTSSIIIHHSSSEHQSNNNNDCSSTQIITNRTIIPNDKPTINSKNKKSNNNSNNTIVNTKRSRFPTPKAQTKSNKSTSLQPPKRKASSLSPAQSSNIQKKRRVSDVSLSHHHHHFPVLQLDEVDDDSSSSSSPPPTARHHHVVIKSKKSSSSEKQRSQHRNHKSINNDDNTSSMSGGNSSSNGHSGNNDSGMGEYRLPFSPHRELTFAMMKMKGIADYLHLAFEGFDLLKMIRKVHSLISSEFHPLKQFLLYEKSRLQAAKNSAHNACIQFYLEAYKTKESPRHRNVGGMRMEREEDEEGENRLLISRNNKALLECFNHALSQLGDYYNVKEEWQQTVTKMKAKTLDYRIMYNSTSSLDRLENLLLRVIQHLLFSSIEEDRVIHPPHHQPRNRRFKNNNSNNSNINSGSCSGRLNDICSILKSKRTKLSKLMEIQKVDEFKDLCTVETSHLMGSAKIASFHSWFLRSFPSAKFLSNNQNDKNNTATNNCHYMNSNYDEEDNKVLEDVLLHRGFPMKKLEEFEVYQYNQCRDPHDSEWVISREDWEQNIVDLRNGTISPSLLSSLQRYDHVFTASKRMTSDLLSYAMTLYNHLLSSPTKTRSTTTDTKDLRSINTEWSQFFIELEDEIVRSEAQDKEVDTLLKSVYDLTVASQTHLSTIESCKLQMVSHTATHELLIRCHSQIMEAKKIYDSLQTNLQNLEIRLQSLAFEDYPHLLLFFHPKNHVVQTYRSEVEEICIFTDRLPFLQTLKHLSLLSTILPVNEIDFFLNDNRSNIIISSPSQNRNNSTVTKISARCRSIDVIHYDYISNPHLRSKLRMHNAERNRSKRNNERIIISADSEGDEIDMLLDPELATNLGGDGNGDEYNDDHLLIDEYEDDFLSFHDFEFQNRFVRSEGGKQTYLYKEYNLNIASHFTEFNNLLRILKSTISIPFISKPLTLSFHLPIVYLRFPIFCLKRSLDSTLLHDPYHNSIYRILTLMSRNEIDSSEECSTSLKDVHDRLLTPLFNSFKFWLSNVNNPHHHYSRSTPSTPSSPSSVSISLSPSPSSSPSLSSSSVLSAHNHGHAIEVEKFLCVRAVFHRLLLSLSLLHSHRIVHRALTPDNILFDETILYNMYTNFPFSHSSNIKSSSASSSSLPAFSTLNFDRLSATSKNRGDFNSNNIYYSEINPIVCHFEDATFSDSNETPPLPSSYKISSPDYKYFAPELSQHSERKIPIISEAVDLYSLGRILYEAYFPNHQDTSINPYTSLLAIPQHQDALELTVLLQKLLSNKPELRGSATELLHDAYFTSIPPIRGGNNNNNNNNNNNTHEIFLSERAAFSRKRLNESRNKLLQIRNEGAKLSWVLQLKYPPRREDIRLLICKVLTKITKVKMMSKIIFESLPITPFPPTYLPTISLFPITDDNENDSKSNITPPHTPIFTSTSPSSNIIISSSNERNHSHTNMMDIHNIINDDGDDDNNNIHDDHHHNTTTLNETTQSIATISTSTTFVTSTSPSSTHTAEFNIGNIHHHTHPSSPSSASSLPSSPHNFYWNVWESFCEDKTILEMTNSKKFMPTPNTQDRRYEFLGKVILKCIMDGELLPPSLPFCLVKMILSRDLNLGDLHEVDPPLAEWLILYSCFPSTIHPLPPPPPPHSSDFISLKNSTSNMIDGSMSGGGGGGGDVSGDQRQWEQIKMICYNRLMDERKSAINLLRKGFYFIDRIPPIIQSLSEMELRLLLYGDRFMDSSMVASLLFFDEGWLHSPLTAIHLLQWVRRTSASELEAFVYFCTGFKHILDCKLVEENYRCLCCSNDPNFDHHRIVVRYRSYSSPHQTIGDETMSPPNDIVVHRHLRILELPDLQNEALLSSLLQSAIFE